jgi:fibronectin-binding autotransporter adhesin
MSLPSWLSPLARQVRPTRKTKKQMPARRARARDLSVEALEGRLVPAGTFTWTGLVLGGAWSSPGNWTSTPTAGLAPTDNDGTDVLKFPNAPLGTLLTNDDISAGKFASIEFEDNYSVLSGGVLDTVTANTISAGLTQPGINPTLNVPITIGASSSLTVNTFQGNLTLGGTSSISGPASSALNLTGAGQPIFQANNLSFSGSVNVQAGVLDLQATKALGVGNTTTVSSGATLELATTTDSSEAINITGTGAPGWGGAITVPTGGVGVNGPIKLNGAATIHAENGGTSNFAGSINLNGKALTLNADSVPGNTIQVSGVISDSGVGGSVTVNNGTSGIVIFNGTAANTYAGTTTLDAGELDLNDSIANGAIVGPLTINGGQVKITAAATEQILNTATVTVNTGGTLNLNGKTETLDPLTLNGGTVDLNGGILILSGNVIAGGPAVTNSAIHDTAGGGHIDLGGATRLFTVATGDQLEITPPITGSGGLTANGAGTLLLDGTNPNTYSGATTASAGTLDLDIAGGGAVPHDLTISGASTIVNEQLSNQIADNSNVSLSTGATLNFGIPATGTSDTIGTLTLAGSTVNIGNGGIVTITSGQLNGDATSNVGFSGTAKLISNGTGTATYAGNLSGTGTFDSQGPGVQILSGTVAAGVSIEISGGELQIDGTDNGVVQVDSGATLGGSGAINGLVTVQGGGKIDPGPAAGGTGQLSTLGGISYVSVTPTSIFHVDITGTTPGANGYDQVIATGQTVGLNGATLEFGGAFCALNGTQFDIITGASAIGGNLKFGGNTLTEGMIFDIGGNTLFKITYLGGAGHDVILTRMMVIDIWTGASQTSNLWSDNLNWAKHTVPLPGDLIEFPGTALQRFNTNDLAAGFKVGEMDFLAGGFHISGNAILIGSGFQNLGATTLNVVSLDSTLTCNEYWKNTGAAFIDSGNVNMGTFSLTVDDTGVGSTTKLAGGLLGSTGGVTKLGPGTLKFAGNTPNTYLGQTNVIAGTLVLAKTNGFEPVPGVTSLAGGTLVIGGSSGAPKSVIVQDLYDNQIAPTTTVQINPTGYLDLTTAVDSIGTLDLFGGSINVGSISGNLKLGGDLFITSDTVIANKLTLIGAGPHTFNVPSGKTLTIPSQITASTASVVITGGGTVVYSGTQENLYTGTTTVQGGSTLDLEKVGAISLFGPLVVGDGVTPSTVTYFGPNQIKDNLPITVNSGSLFNTAGFSDEVGGLTLNNSSITTGAGTLTINGNITSTGTSMITGNLYIKEVNRIVNVVGNTDVLSIGNVTSIFNAALVKQGLGTLNLLGTQPTSGVTTVTAGTLNVGTTIASASVSGSGILNLGATGIVTGTVTLAPSGILNLAVGSQVQGGISGSGGTVNGSIILNGVTNLTGVTINPGTPFGSPTTTGTILNNGTLTLAPTTILNLKLGPTTGLSDQLVQAASGALDLNNAPLNVSLVPGYVSNIGNTFVLVSSPTQGILGQFSNAHDLAILTNVSGSGHNFQVHYELDPTLTFVQDIRLTQIS